MRNPLSRAPSRSANRRRLAQHIGTLTAVAAALFPSVAQAESPSYGGGAFVGYTFGPRHGVEWGFEAFATHRFANASCFSDEPRYGLGPLLQFGIIGIRDPRLTLAAQGGGEISRFTFAMSGELGATYRFGNDPGFGLHTGLSGEITFFNVALRRQWFLDDTWVGGGMRVQPTYGDQARCEVGRPLRTETGQAAVAGILRCEEKQGGIAKPARHHPEAGRAWARDAELECASILAFLHLAAELLAHDAPEALIEDVLDAACDEIRHAALCAQLASRLLGSALWPALPTLVPRPSLPGEAGLRRLATESWLDGALGEGAAARQAQRAAERASNAVAVAAQHTITRDESRHAALAWRILDWSIARGGAPVLDAVWDLRDRHPADAIDLALHGAERYGVLGPDACRKVAHETAAQCRDQLESLARRHAASPCTTHANAA